MGSNHFNGDPLVTRKLHFGNASLFKMNIQTNKDFSQHNLGVRIESVALIRKYMVTKECGRDPKVYELNAFRLIKGKERNEVIKVLNKCIGPASKKDAMINKYYDNFIRHKTLR